MPTALKLRGELGRPIEWTEGDENLRALSASIDAVLSSPTVEAYGTGATTRTALEKFADIVDARDYATLTAAFAVSNEVRVTSAITVAVNTAVPFGKRLVVSGGSITINTGITLDFAGDLDGPETQIFYGAGLVRFLHFGRLEWFAGNARGIETAPSVIECRALIQRAIDAMDFRGLLVAGMGSWLIDGSVPMTVSKPINMRFAGEEATVFRWQGTATNGFYFPPDVYGARATGFKFKPNVAGTIPTTGIALDVQNSYTHLSDYFIEDPYQGTRHQNAVACWNYSFQIIGARQTGRLIRSCLDIHSDKYIVQALYDWTTLSSITGTWSVGDEFTLSTGQTGTVVVAYGSGKFRMRFVGPLPVSGATMANTTSGGTATLASITVGHALGGYRLEEANEAITEGKGDVLGGMYSFTAGTTGALPRGGAAFNRMGDVYFDSSYLGSSVDRLFGWKFFGTWFASAANAGSQGLYATNCKRMYGHGMHFVNNAGPGLTLDGTSSDWEMHGPDFDGNCTLGGAADWVVGGGFLKLRIFGGSAGYQGSNGITPPKAIVFNAGASNEIKVIGMDVPSGSITNGATGTDQTWFGVPGVPDRRNAANYSNAANDAAAASAGVPVGGQYRNGSVLQVRIT